MKNGPFRVETVQDAFTKLYSCVFEINMMVKSKDGCGPSKGAGSRRVQDGSVETAQDAVAKL